MPETGATSYDGFLSYSHAADDLLAPRLQAGLQRFAKPWWRRRALRVFRDEASLSANPHLWSSITDALDDSDWFVLLLSPDAAQSKWVNREIDYWKEHKDPQMILPVVTDGEFGWSEGDVAGDAVPPSLQGVFADEPRWVDLRFARTETQLDLRHVRFRDTVADIAAAIRGVPKDELASEEVRQHRRTVRTAWTAGVAILALGVAATVGAIVAYNAQQDARSERDRAVAAEDTATEERDRAIAAEETATQERDRAVAAEEEAEQQRTLAEQEADRAEENAAAAVRAAEEARARELAGAALLSLEFDPERSILLALEAATTTQTELGQVLEEPVTALRQALAASRVVSRIAGGWFADFSPDGTLLATGPSGGEWDDVIDSAIWDVETGEQIHFLPAPEGREMDTPSFSPDGQYLAVPYTQTRSGITRNPSRPTDGSTHQAGPLATIWDVETGEPVRSFGGPNNTADGTWAGFSPDGTMLAVDTPGLLVVWDVTSETELYSIEHGDATSHSFSPDGTVLAVADRNTDSLMGSHILLYDARQGTRIDSLDVGELNPAAAAFDPSNRWLAALSQSPEYLMVWDVKTWEPVFTVQLGGLQTQMAWSPDGEVIAVTGTEGIVRLFDVPTGDEVLSLLGHDAAIWGLEFSPDGERIAGAGAASDTVIWDITAAGGHEVAGITTPYSKLWTVGVQYTTDASSVLVFVYEGSGGRVLARLDASTGEVLAEIPDQLLAGGGYAHPIVVPEAGLVGSLNTDGTATLHDAETFTPVMTLPESHYALAVTGDRSRVVLKSLESTEARVVEAGSWEEITTFDTTQHVSFSSDGTLLTGNYSVGVIDLNTGAHLATAEEIQGDSGWLPVGFSPDGSWLSVRSPDGHAGLIDIAALRAGKTPEEALVVNIDAHDGIISDSFTFSRDSSLFATWGWNDKHVKVWRTDNGQLIADLGEIDADWPGFDFHPNGKHLLVEGVDGTLRTHAIDTNELIEIARSRVTRSFTEDECTTYRIDPCPDLEMIRGG